MPQDNRREIIAAVQAPTKLGKDRAPIRHAFTRNEGFMTRDLPVMYTLPFSHTFDAPVGAIIEYVGMAKWLYRSPDTGEVTTFVDSQANSYARDTGGMKGTRWAVVMVVE